MKFKKFDKTIMLLFVPIYITISNPLIHDKMIVY